MIALGGFIANSESLEKAAAFTSASFSYFLSGLFFAFVAFFFHLVMAAGRFDAYTQYLDVIGKKIKNVPSMGIPHDVRSAWRSRAVFYTVAVIIAISHFGSILTSGGFFFLGSAHVVTGLSKVSCSSLAVSEDCSKSLPFPLSIASDNEFTGASVGLTGRSTTSARANEHWVESIKVVSADRSVQVGDVYFDQIVRLSRRDAKGDFHSCYLSFGSFLSGDALSYDRNEESNRLIEISARNVNAIDIRPAELNVTVFVERNRQLVDMVELSVTAGPNEAIGSGQQIERKDTVRALVSLRSRALLAFVPSDASQDCKALIREAGFKILPAI